MRRTKRSQKPRGKGKRGPKNRWSPKVGHSSTRSTTRIAPDELDVKLMYRRTEPLSNGSGGSASKGFHSNGAYDVDPSLSSTETYGFDEYAALYTYYRVIGYSYEATFVNQASVEDAKPMMAYVLNTNVDPSISGNSYGAYSTNPHCRSKLISYLSPNMHTFRGSHTIAQITGTSACETADSFRALVSTIPSDLTWFTIAVESIGGATVTSTVDVKLIMHVRFYSRDVDLVLSARIEKMNNLVFQREQYQLQKRQRLLRNNSKEKIDRPVLGATKQC